MSESLVSAVVADGVGTITLTHAVNASRGGADARAADWDEQVWIGFEPSSAIVLAERINVLEARMDGRPPTRGAPTLHVAE